jgi:glutamine synthetase
MIKKFLHYVESNEIEFIHFEFTDLIGVLRRITMPVQAINENILINGLCLNESLNKTCEDKIQLSAVPDLNSFYQDPFLSHKSLIIKCDIVNSYSNTSFVKDARLVTKNAEEYLKNFSEFHQALFGVSIEFFIFDDIRFINNKGSQTTYIESDEAYFNYNKIMNNVNSGHRPKSNGAYLNVSPLDNTNDIRAEIMNNLQEIGINPLLHYHALAPSQAAVTLSCDTLLKTADNIQNFKYIVKNTVASFGKTATFMPLPIEGENGSGMYISNSLLVNGSSIFNNKNDNELSQLGFYYIGGILKHAQAIAAFTNSTTNSYKKLADRNSPKTLTYSEANTAALKIINNMQLIEARFPDAASNAYLAIPAIVMAGLDGIENKIHPKEMSENKTLDTSLKASLTALKDNHEFLLKGKVFNKELINAYLSIKFAEVEQIERLPHPEEFNMYYSC